MIAAKLGTLLDHITQPFDLRKAPLSKKKREVKLTEVVIFG